jgi:hypothetical protein
MAPPSIPPTRGVFVRLGDQVAKPWFPLVIIALSAASCFAIFLSGAVTALFISACVARGKGRFAHVALANALGVALGFGIFIVIVKQRGMDAIRASYPSLFASTHWGYMEGVIARSGWGGVAALAAPLPLHPLVLMGMLSGMSSFSILSAAFAGRFAKYYVMGLVATRGEGVLAAMRGERRSGGKDADDAAPAAAGDEDESKKEK